MEKMKDGSIAPSLKGGLGLEGVIEKQLPLDEYGQPSWVVRISHVYFGADQLDGDRITVISPTIRGGGITLKTGETYRMYIVRLNGRFYIWNGSVVSL
ncbi:MAG TPA: hypothetical protein VHC22_19320 [Pirellulales bacterium]|nr:hypothetical protein [Pirellulales bacterium]